MAVVSASTRASIFGQPGQVQRVQVVTPWGLPTLCHALIAPLFLAACAEAERCAWRPLRIDSYNPRPIRGLDGSSLDEWSLHAWCLAWDFFATPPGVAPPGGVWTPDNGVTEEFAECFERYGFRWGGRWTDRPDVPHIEWAGGRPPAVQPQEDDMTPEQATMLQEAHAAVFSMLRGNYESPAAGDLSWLARQLAPVREQIQGFENKFLAFRDDSYANYLLIREGGGDGGDLTDEQVQRIIDALPDAVKQALREGVG